MKSRRFRQAVAISLAAVMSVSVISFTGGGRRADADVTEAVTTEAAEFYIDPMELNTEAEVPTQIPADMSMTAETTETTEAADTAGDDVSTEEALDSETADASTESVTTEAAETSETTETAGTTEAAVTEAEPEETLVVFDHVYNENAPVSGKDFSSCELLAKADPSVFTKNTEVVSVLNGVYMLRFGSAEETKNAYTYYYDKVQSLDVNVNAFTISSENTDVPVTEAPATEAPAPETTETQTAETRTAETEVSPVPDVADLSSVNTGDDAFSNVSDLPDISLNGAIAVIDTGCSGANVKKAVSVLGGSTADDNGHGTAMMDAIVNEYNGASILSIKALDASGRAQVSDIYAAIKYAVDSNVSVISLSMAALRTSETALVEQAVNEALSKGIVVVGAAGNQGSDASSFIPGGMSGVITAGSCDETGTRQAFSNYGSAVDYNIVSSSTSEACAMLAAMIARDGVSGLKVNEGNLFATDYVPETSTGTDGSETEPAVTTETITTEEAVTETTTEATTTEETATADATASDSGKKKWNIGDLINGLFEMQNSVTDTEYSLGGHKVTVLSRDNPLIAIASINESVSGIAYCGSHLDASPFSYYASYVNGRYTFETMDAFSGDGRNTRMAFWDKFRGADPAVPLSAANGQNSEAQKFSVDYLTPRSKYAGAHLPDSSNFKVCDIYGNAILTNSDSAKKNVSLEINNISGTSIYRTQEFKVFTDTSDYGDCIQARIQYSGCTIHYKNRNGSDYVHGTSTSGDMRVNDGETIYFEFEKNQTPSITFSAVRKGTNDTAHYIGPAYKFRPTSSVSGSSGTKSIQPLLTVTSTTVSLTMNLAAGETESLVLIKSLENNTNWDHKTDISGASYGVYTSMADAQSKTNAVGYCAIKKNEQAGIAISNVSTLVNTDINGNGTDVVLSLNQPYYIREVQVPTSGYWQLDQSIYGPYTMTDGAVTVVGSTPLNYDGTSATYPSAKQYSFAGGQIGPERINNVDVSLTKYTDPSNVSCVLGNPNYSLTGAQYTLYKTKEKNDANIVKDVNGNNAVFTLTEDPNHPGQTLAASIKLQMPSATASTVYYLYETKAPKNYQIDEEWHRVIINPSDAGTTIPVTVTDRVTLDPFVTSMYKVDAKTGEAVADAHGTLTSAKYTMRFYAVDVTRTYTAAELKAMDPAREWVFATKPETDSNGSTVYRFYYLDSYKVSGPDLYKDPSGNAQLPLGYITIEETTAPAGYTTAGAKYNVVYRDGTTGTDDNGVIVARADADGDVYVGNKPVSEKIINLEKSARADIRMVKKDDAGNRLKNCKFRVTNLDTTESHIFFTDENGEFDTSKVDASLPANAMDTADSYSKAPVWFGIRADGSYADFSDTVSALNYGTYRIEELPCKANKGLQLMHPVTVNVTEALVKEAIAKGEKMVVTLNEGTLDTDAIVDMENPYIKTEALSKKTGDSVLPVSEDETLIDRVHYYFLKADTEYTLHAELMVKHKDGSFEPFTRDDGTAYAEDHPFKTSADYTVSMYEKCGTEEVEFPHVDTTKLKEGDSLVVFESLSLADGSVRYAERPEDEEMFPITEKDINNKDQTLTPVTIHTDAADTKTASQTAGTRKMMEVTDHVHTNGLIIGKKYTVKGELHRWGLAHGTAYTDATNTDADDYEANLDLYTPEELTAMGYEDKGVLTDADGNAITGETTFTATEEDQTVKVTFTFDASILAGETIVVYEDMYHNGELIAAHRQITDERQTIHHPKLKTSLINDATLTREALADYEADLTDVVAYKNVKAGSLYTVYGILMDKTTKMPLVTKDGSYVTGHALLDLRDVEVKDGETKRVDGTVNVKYHFDSTGMEGTDIVAFERLVEGDKPGTFTDVTASGTDAGATDSDAGMEVLARHEDINDNSQTIHFPKVGTQASGDVENLSNADEDATVTDAVSYENLRPETKYELTGTVHLQYEAEDENGNTVIKDAGTLKDASGKTVQVKKTFTTGKANNDLGGVDGTETLAFKVNAKDLAGRSVTVFEHLTRNGVLVGMHAEIGDEGQTVKFPELKTSVTDKQTKNKISYAASVVTITDTVHYENLVAGREYTVEGVLHVKNTGYTPATNTDATPLDAAKLSGNGMSEKTVLYVNGKPVTGTETFTAEAPEGDVDVTFTFDASALGGYTLVAAEKMYRNGILIGVHADIRDKQQTGNVPLIKTLAVNDATGEHEVNADNKAAFTDYVYYTNLQAGMNYRVKGTLMDKSTGKAVTVNEKAVASSVDFTVQGTEDLFYNTVYKTETGTYDYSDRAGYTDSISTDTDALIASASDGRTEVRARRTVTESAVIAYFTNGTSVRIPTRKYVVLSENGQVSVKLEQTAKASDVKDAGTTGTVNETGGIDGIVAVPYAFDASDLKGHDTVVFEELYLVHEDGTETLVADHKNMEDEDQTITFPEIHTTFTDRVSNSHQIAAGQTEVTLVDTVEYKNLVVGREYTVTGTVHVGGNAGRYKKGDVLKYADGTPVTKTVTFTAVQENGSVDVVFTIPASLIPKEKLVAFEDVRYKDVTVAVHADIEDEGQTVTPPPSGPPKTGIIILAVLGIIAGISLAGLFITRKKRK